MSIAFPRMVARAYALAALLCWVPGAGADSAAHQPKILGGGPYVMTANTVDAGGGVASGGPYRLAGTTGQPDAGTLAAARYSLRGGFWQAPAPAATGDAVFSSGFESL